MGFLQLVVFAIFIIVIVIMYVWYKPPNVLYPGSVVARPDSTSIDASGNVLVRQSNGKLAGRIMVGKSMRFMPGRGFVAYYQGKYALPLDQFPGNYVQHNGDLYTAPTPGARATLIVLQPLGDKMVIKSTKLITVRSDFPLIIRSHLKNSVVFIRVAGRNEGALLYPGTIVR